MTSNEVKIETEAKIIHQNKPKSAVKFILISLIS